MLAWLCQTTVDDLFKPGGKIGSVSIKRWGFAIKNCNQEVGGGRAGERRHARHHLVEQNAQTEDVAAHIHLLPARLLWRHITRRAHHHAGSSRDGETERG